MFLNDIKHNWIGKVPNHWDVKRIKHLFHIKKEISEIPENEEVLSLTFGGIIKRDITTNEGQLPETYKGYTKIYPDDIVMNPMDLRSGWVDRSKYEGIISPSYYVLNKNTESTDIGYFNYQFQRHYKERIFFPFGQGVSYDYRWGLGKETLLNFPIIVPPPSEQKQIVSFLDHKTLKIEELIEKTEQKVELLKEKRISLINHCVTKGLNPNVEMKDSGVEWIGEIPVGWDTKKLKYVLKKKPDNGIFKKKDEFGDGVRLINVGDLYDENNFISQETLDRVLVNESELEKYKAQNNNLFFVRSSLKLEGIGVSSIIDNLEEPTVFECHIIRIIPNQSTINPYYLKLYLNSNLTRNRFISISQTVTMTTISQDHITSLEIVYPPIIEQRQIVEYLDEQTQKIDTTIEKEIQRIELLKEYRQSLISDVVTGKIDVRDEVAV